ncbi:Bromodomain-containing protein, partial [Mycena crocata]
LKEHGDARPFLEPVDSVGLGLLHYNNIVRTPMDLSTVERKLISSNPSQPDPIPENPRYLGVEGLIDDVQLIVSNCVLFNGVEGFISYSAWAIEDFFVEQMKSLPGK